MNAIIIAAGTGTRISQAANDPKALLDINGKTILSRQISLLNEEGIQNIIIITGSHSDKFELKNVTCVQDRNFLEHDILGSLMEAKNYFKNELLILYSDILFESSILEQVINSDADIGIAVDLTWEKAYINRTSHPKSEAENVLLNNNNRIIQIKKNILNNQGLIGEFLGILKLSAKGSKTFVQKYNELIKNHSGKFHEAPSLSKAYLTDMIQEIIDSKIEVIPIFIDGKWCEIDTQKDLEKAKKLFP